MTITGFGGVVDPERLIGRVGAFGLHTIAVYVCAVHLSPWLVSRWFAWGAPLLQVPTVTPPGDWYLQHMELASIIPAALIGYIVARRAESVATWTWGIPALALVYSMLRYQAPSSVLIGTSLSTLKYFFDIQTPMPTIANPTASDPVRALAQILITAPFYAGLAYSLGAQIAKRRLIKKLLSFANSQT